MNIEPYIRTPHFYETDQMGIIHHSNYIKWFEEARVDFMNKTGYGYDKMTRTGIDIAVLSVSCDYQKMIRYGETVKIYAEITELTPTRMTVNYKIVKAETDEITTVGESRHCFYSREKQRPISLRKELPELFEIFESVQIKYST